VAACKLGFVEALEALIGYSWGVTVDTRKSYDKASTKTADNLRTIARLPVVRDLSPLSLPEIDAVVDLVARMVPSGNVPGVILNGLARLPGRKPPFKTVKRDINLLFKGVEQILDRAVYGAFFAGPAAVIWGYQNLLKLAGKDVEDSFPEGMWQFYVDYALREDTARHGNETHGFDTVLKRHQICPSAVDRITAWVMTALHCLHQYNDLLENEWRERVHIHLLREVTRNEPDAARYAWLYRAWEKQRPYGRGSDALASDTYPIYRRRRFDCFLEEATRDLRNDLRQEWVERIRVAEAGDLAAYQQQMSILAYLEPGPYGETRTPIPLEQTHVGVIDQQCYYLIPVCAPGTAQPADVTTVRAQIATLMAYPSESPPAQLVSLARIKRAALARLRKKMDPAVIRELDVLRLAPILINCDQRPRHLPLSELRQAERGVGDHALTLFDTGETVVFDQSHIFFDGAWGAALAEIMTNEALSWAVYLNALPPAQPGKVCPYALDCQLHLSELDLVQQMPQVMPEANAETDAVDLEAILTLRELFKQRSDSIQLTVNDLLVLYRAIHAFTYQPDPDLIAELQGLACKSVTRQAALAALEAIEHSRRVNPAIGIPIDASQRSPRDRLFPMTFEVPLDDLDLLNLHEQIVEALKACENATGDSETLYADFDRLQRTYLATLAGFGAVMSRAKEMALMGKSTTMGSIKLLAHMPIPLQRMLDKIPGRFNVVNDLVKGREIISNLGAVAPSSSLTRFITAKDDNEQKTLAWGVITDANGVMHILLRDFRPHVGMLEACGCRDMAARIAQDYLDAYAQGLNSFIRDLRFVTLANRETRF
jgi:hypothetical protein